MKQILQDMAKGGSEITEAPCPSVSRGHLLINTSASLISAGTERMLVGFGKANYIDKARQQPEKVKMVLEKVQTDGLMTTIDAVKSKLGQPLPLGYCNVGYVHEVGVGAEQFKAGDRVVSNGPHADVVRVAKNLCAKIPDNVSDQQAAFTVVASIGLQGIRLIKPTLGESIVVTGVGLIGLLTVQLLKAHGCRVLAIDYDHSKLELAKRFGAEICNPGRGEDPVAAGLAFSRGQGVDGVIITASTKSNDPVTQGARMSRKRGRIVLVGVVGLELNRADFYEKELSFQVSCSYGPGRYDSSYEENGNDYPYGFVRWTQQRNFVAILDMMATGQLDVMPLITNSFEFDNAKAAYDLLTEDASALGLLLKYSSNVDERHVKNVKLIETNECKPSAVTLGFVGAGNYASRTLIPAFKAANAVLHSLATSGGVNSAIHGAKNGFRIATTDTTEMIKNPDINTIAIVTQHNSHASFINQALECGKHIFVEKPLAINYEQLESVRQAYINATKSEEKPLLMVGFNRRFSPHIQKMKSLLTPIKTPKSFIMTMNAGDIPAEHWVHDLNKGGGRIIGEACHYIDLMRFLVGHEIKSVQAIRMGAEQGVDIVEDKATISLGFTDGSFGTIHYFANGSNSFPKERIEIFAGGKILQLDNFVKLTGYGFKGFKKMNLWRQDKGQKACTKAFVEAIENGGKPPIAIDELFEVAKITIDVATLLREQG
ncbi:bi-domain-containing oxidoreductase [Brumicola pallidula]|uniref:Myo-inositol 2-dehydrogenase n=1 Tax=Brumicola pallidula DSM 14239 = ACAM 615 TaxID=1121922 RepID=K6Z122_9ALTE|nr:bi-domain-containing oxidoreductase [Glaciecola pallidula]GAC29871.1 myo-inositol 2-dehydrogenase [Glaciecola pallidula DSM 14239 = ACAM 615]